MDEISTEETMTREQLNAERSRIDAAMLAFKKQVETYHPQQLIMLDQSMADAMRTERSDLGRYALSKQISIVYDVYRAKTGRSITFAY